MPRSSRPFIAIAAVACFTSFSWGVLRHFERSGPVPRGMLVISGVSLGGFTLFLVELARAKRRPRVVPLALMGGSLAGFWWSVTSSAGARLAVAFDDAEPGPLLRTGPWRFVRHPFYTSYLMFWLATALAVARPMMWINALSLGLLYIVAAYQEERQLKSSSASAEYTDYSRRTPMFVPRFRLRRPSFGRRNFARPIVSKQNSPGSRLR